jgi:hypothetical protein
MSISRYRLRAKSGVPTHQASLMHRCARPGPSERPAGHLPATRGRRVLASDRRCPSRPGVVPGKDRIPLTTNRLATIVCAREGSALSCKKGTEGPIALSSATVLPSAGKPPPRTRRGVNSGMRRIDCWFLSGRCSLCSRRIHAIPSNSATSSTSKPQSSSRRPSVAFARSGTQYRESWMIAEPG